MRVLHLLRHHVQVSREEKYKAKLTIDAVVQRLGDTVAALVFEILGRRVGG